MPPGFVQHVPGVPRTAVRVSSQGVVTVVHDFKIPPVLAHLAPDLQLSAGEKLARIVGTLLRVLERPGEPERDEGAPPRVVDPKKPGAPSPVHRALAYVELANDPEFDVYGPEARDEAVSMLAKALYRDLSRFARQARAALIQDDAKEEHPAFAWERIEADLKHEADEKGGDAVLWLDTAGAEWIEGSGEKGAQLAADLRRKSRERAHAWRSSLAFDEMEADHSPLWSAWLDYAGYPTPIPWAHKLATALWCDEVGPQWRDKQRVREAEAATKSPAQPLLLAQTFAAMTKPPEIRDDGHVYSDGTRTDFLVATDAPAVDLELVRRITAHLSTVVAHRTVYWYAKVAWLCHLHGGVTAGEGWKAVRTGTDIEVTTQGGYTGLKNLVGQPGRKKPEAAFETMNALSWLRHRTVYIPAGPGQDRPRVLAGALVTAIDRPEDGERGPIVVRLSAHWSVNFVQSLAPQERILVPMLPVPPMHTVGRRIHPVCAALERSALVRLATQSRRYFREAAAPVDWRQLSEGRIKPKNLESLIAGWTEEDRWRHVGGGRWRLGEGSPEVKAAHELLVEGGKIREGSATRGRKRSSRKRGKKRR